MEDILYYIKDIQAAFFFRSKFVPWLFGRWLPQPRMWWLSNFWSCSFSSVMGNSLSPCCCYSWPQYWPYKLGVPCNW
jgi:hypothetical protein